jgi:hypothetical protein
MIEQRLRLEETEILQGKIRTNALTEEATEIAKKILSERNAAIPIAETEEETEAKYQNNSKVSLILFLLFASYVLILWFGDYSFGRFVLLTIALISAVVFTRNQRK